jgi:CRP-like cAMP-binding protein
MIADVLGVKIDAQVIAELVGAMGAILAALISTVGRRVKRVEQKIDGLQNGDRAQAMAAIAEIQREREERRIMGLPARRKTDLMPLPKPPGWSLLRRKED